MELTNEFDVPAPLDEAWPILTDIELIAPCMPGARLTEVEGDTFRGIVKVKVGPIAAQFKGEASFVEKDADAHRAVLKAQGRDTGGKGNANATITAQLQAAGDGTRVTITTDLAISGRVAQFGRGALADVSTKLLGQFIECLEHRVLSDGPAAVADASAVLGPAAAGSPSIPAGSVADTDTTGSGATGAPLGARRIDAPEAEPIDLLHVAGTSLTKRLVLGGLTLLLVLWLLRRRRS